MKLAAFAAGLALGLALGATASGSGERPSAPVAPLSREPRFVARTASPVVGVPLGTLGPSAVPVAASEPAPSVVQDAMTGRATWYCGHGSPCTRGYSGGMIAAAGPALRSAIGSDWRGRVVRVELDGRAVDVKLVDSCVCASLIDLSADAFAQLASLSTGVIWPAVSLR